MEYKRIIKIILLINIIFFCVSIFQKNQLPDKENILEQLYQEPAQTETDIPPFEIKQKDIVYNIVPLYNYELYGLVVSYHNSESWLDYYHDKWNDFLNLKDICVIWGDNIETEVYQKMKFKNRSYSCVFSFKRDIDPIWYKKFNKSLLSNNHLLSDDEEISKKIISAEKGDQIYLKGYLVEYSHDEGEGFERGSSTSRTDREMGACETIYVTDFQILEKTNVFWYFVYFYTKYFIACCLILLTILFFATPMNKYSNYRE